MSLLKQVYLDKPLLEAPRQGFGEALVEAGQQDENIYVLTADLAESTKTHLFKQKFPDRFVESGIAEQNMLTVAVGLSLVGKIPVVSTYAAFSPGRLWDQLRVSVCYNKANIKLTGHHAGLSVGLDGATHQMLEDLALTRVLPGLMVLAPADYRETKVLTSLALKHKGPVYLRFGRESEPQIFTSGTKFKLGRAESLLTGLGATIVTTGSTLYPSLIAAQELKAQSVSVGVLHCSTVKPLDQKAVIQAAKQSGALVTVEEHQVAAGFGGAVLESLAATYPVPVVQVGVEDAFGESGLPRDLRAKYGLDVPAIKRAVSQVIKLKKGS